jgi:hypothetical protein
MPRAPAELPDITLEQLRQRMAANGVKQILMKELAPNDNSKNQPYLGGSLEAANILPITGEVRAEVTAKGNESMKAALPFWWLQPDGSAARAPGAQLILYPQYPEVRLSGFLKGAVNAPSELMNTRLPGRILFLGITKDSRIIAWATGPDSALAWGFRALWGLEQMGVFQVLPVESAETRTSKERLLAELRRINLLGWVDSKALKSDGSIVPCTASQCVGYTLEAELGVARNGRSEPDFLGWEVKASEVTAFDRPPPAKAITLMTPEPTGGFYRNNGVEAFIRKYGYADKKGREDRMNFGGIFRAGQLHEGTGLTLTLSGFDATAGKITNASGSLALIDGAGNAAAEWSFAHLMGIWNRKHAQAVYVPSLAKQEPVRQYSYGGSVRLAEGTDFTRLIKAVAAGAVYYDPGIKLEGVSTDAPETKRRSQFRVRSSELGQLYAAMVEQPL